MMLISNVRGSWERHCHPAFVKGGSLPVDFGILCNAVHYREEGPVWSVCPRSLMDLIKSQREFGVAPKTVLQFGQGLNCCFEWADNSGLGSGLFRLVHVNPTGPLCVWSSSGRLKTLPTVPLEVDKELSKPAAKIKACTPDHLMELRMVKFISLAYCVYKFCPFLSGFNSQLKLFISTQCSTMLVLSKWLRVGSCQVIWTEFDSELLLRKWIDSLGCWHLPSVC